LAGGGAAGQITARRKQSLRRLRIPDGGTMSKIEQLRMSGQLPSPKGVALSIMQISQRDDATLDEVARLVQTDPALSGRLLRLANNASSYKQRVVASITDAVLCLGMTTVRQLAMGFSLVDQYPNGLCAGFDYPGFWSESLFMAVASQELAGLVRVGTPDELFACGLLAKIGALALVTAYPVDYAAILDEQRGGARLVELERERLGVDHIELTAAILADCGIPKALADPIHHHEAVDGSGFAEGSRAYRLTHLFALARAMAELGLSAPNERQGNLTQLMHQGEKVGLDANVLGEVFGRVVKQWHAWAELLKLPAGYLPPLSTLTETLVNGSGPVPRQGAEPAPEAPPGLDAAPASGGSRTTRKRVLLVEDDETSRIMTETALSQLFDCSVFTAQNGREALVMALEVMPQVIITDWVMPVVDGLEFCRALRATEWGQSMYVIMLTGQDNEEKIVEAFEAGVDDYVTKPINIRALNARMRAALHYVNLLDAWEHDRAQLKQLAAELAISNRRFEHAAMTDLLTGIPNRRAGVVALTRAWNSSTRTGGPVAALMIDVDHFKSINDRYGHAAGDQVLQEVAKAIEAIARKDDSSSRFGGEEFMVVCHHADAKAGLQAAERMRRMVKALKIVIAGVELRVTVSIGVASRETGMGNVEAMLNAADKALYAAKNAGRDRVCLFADGKFLGAAGD
jgi:two-component system cell cycle response regulator